MNSTALAAQFRTSCRAFRHRNYQFYFVGQLVSNIGNWVQSVAQAWLVYQLTGSSELLGVTAFAQQIPFFLFGPLAGAVADRYDRRVTLLITHWSAILLTFTLALLTLTGMVQVWQVVTIALLHGTVNSVDIPTRQAFVREIVGLEDLPNAVALNSSMLTGARLIGPAFGGLLVGAMGEGWCFFVNGLSFLAVVACLLVIRPDRANLDRSDKKLLDAMWEGVAFLRSAQSLHPIFLVCALVGVMAMPYNSLLPIFASQILGGGPKALGIMMSAIGIGAFIGALMVTGRNGLNGSGRWMAWSVVGFGLSLALFALSRSFWLSTALLLIAGLAHMVQMTVSLTVVQTMVPDRIRGRVLAVFSMIQQGTPPFGSLGAGLLAAGLGAPFTVALGGAATILGGLVYGYSKLSIQTQNVDLTALPDAAGMGTEE